MIPSAIDESDRHWIAQTHPTTWTNPRPQAKKYDLVVVGGGTAGLVSAVGAAGIGARVALVERSLLGGDCLGAGCVPSKALLRSAKVLLEIRQAEKVGVEVGPAKPHFDQIMARMRKLRNELSQNDSAQRLSSLGIDLFFGQASFTGPRHVRVEEASLAFKRCILATGGRADIPQVTGLAEAGYLTNETLFGLTDLPARLVIVGGGPIGCEMAQAFRQFGAEVTIITRGDRLLPADNEAAARIVQTAFAEQGIVIHHGAALTQVKRPAKDSPCHVTFRMGKGSSAKEQTVEAEAILMATGRVANTEGMNLSAAKVTLDKSAIGVNDFLQTSNPAIYAAGDCIGGPLFTHAADAMARTCIQNAFFSFGPFGKKRFHRENIPRTTYTSPEVTSIGLTAKEAEKRGIAIDTYTQDLARVDRAVLESAGPGFAEVYCAKGSGKILGGTIVSPHAGELMGELGLAVQQNIPLGKMGGTIHCYPTEAETLKKLADQFGRTRLTPTVAKLLRTIIAWRS